MQNSFAKPEQIIEWLHNEMGYIQLGLYSTKHSFPPSDSFRKVYRGNMIPVWNFLLNRVKSEKTVTNLRRNILVHGGKSGKRIWRKVSGSREVALQERDVAENEVERLRWYVRRKRKELKDAMVEVSREEDKRKHMLDERGNYRHKHVTLEAYDRQCDESTKVFSEYHKRLSHYVNEAKDAQKSRFDSSMETDTSFQANNEKGGKSYTILIETDWESKVRKVCESIATLMSDKIQSSFSAYEESGIDPYQDAAKLGFDTVGNLPTDIEDAIADCLSSPSQLVQGISCYTQQLTDMISKEIEKTDVKADVEALRYMYENGVLIDASSPDKTSTLPIHTYGDEKLERDAFSSRIDNLLTERQKAHVQKFLAVENVLNNAAEAKAMTELLLKHLHESSDAQNMSSLEKLKLQVWTKERAAAGLRASLRTLMSEVHRLDNLCEERKEAESSARKKWKQIKEYDARRSELESVCNALLKANMDAASFWSKQALFARECASSTILPACNAIIDLSNKAKDLIDNEVSAFNQTPNNSQYMLPSTSQALMESMGVNSYTETESVANAERNANLLTARAGAMNPSAIPSICRISAALQYPANVDGMGSGLTSVLDSMEFCLKLRGSEACILEDLAKAINLVHVRRDLVENGDTLLNHAHHALHEYDRTTTNCLNVASEQEETVTEKWLPELSNSVQNAEQYLQHRKSGLIEEWLEPASTVVDWVSVDGENVSSCQNNAKQLDAFFDKLKLPKPSFWQSYLNLNDPRLKLSKRCPHCVDLYFS